MHYLLESVNHVTFPREVTKETVREFDQLTVSWVNLKVQLHVLDLNQVARLHTSFFPKAVQFRKKVEEKSGCRMVSINAAPNIVEQMRNAGVLSALGYLKNNNQVRKEKNEDTDAETREWIAKSLIESSRKAMTVMFKTTADIDEKFKDTIKNLHPERFSRISMIISVGPSARLTVRLYFEKPVLTKLIQQAMPDVTEVDETVLDSMATELLNITYNSAKSILNDERGYQMPVGMPSLVTPAQALSQRFGHWRDSRVIPIITPLGTYYVELEFHF